MLAKNGHLILLLPGDVESELLETFATHKGVIKEAARRFSKILIFSPLALLGRGLVLVATEVHSPYRIHSEKQEEVAKSISNYVKVVTAMIEKQFMLPWTDLDYYDHKRASTAWNVF